MKKTVFYLVFIFFFIYGFLSIDPACAEESGDGSTSAPIYYAVVSTGSTGGDTGTGDTGSGDTSGDAGDSGTGYDTGTGDTSGDAGDSGTGDDTGTGDTGSGDTGSGDTGDSGTGDDSSGGTSGDTGTTPVLLTTITPVTLSSSSDGGSGSSDGTGDSGSGGALTLAIVSVSLPPAGAIPLNVGGGDGYTFTGNYNSGGENYIEITGSGTADSPKYYYLNGNLATTHTFAIKITGSHVILDGQDNTGTYHSITGSDTNTGISLQRGDVTVQNVDVSHFITGIYSSSAGATITGNTVSLNMCGISSDGEKATITGNTANKNNGDGIYSDGAGATITGNTANENLHGIYSDGAGATITGNIVNKNTENGIVSYGTGVTITGNTANENQQGIYLTNDGATITGNTASENQYGFTISDYVEDMVISGNRITRNSDGGIFIESNGGSGINNAIYNNYLANEHNIVRGFGANPGVFTWNNPLGPTAGTNVVGGPTIAGNYWSNPAGTGWSDERYDPDGYSKTEDYEVVAGSGVYDHDPLVTYPNSVHVSRKYGTGTLSSPDSIPADLSRIVVVSLTIPPGTSPGSTTTLTLTLRQDGSLPLPQTATYIFVPADEAAAALGEFTATVTNGQFDEVTLPFTVPSEPGVYEYSFTPYLVQTNPLTGEEIRVPAGPLVTFTVTVGDDGSVSVS